MHLGSSERKPAPPPLAPLGAKENPILGG